MTELIVPMKITYRILKTLFFRVMFCLTR